MTQLQDDPAPGAADGIALAAAGAAGADALKVFISYSRRDMAAADAMVADLERNGFAVTIDRRDLPYGEEWQQELAGFIAASDTVVWLVSPDSVKSKWVNWELGEVGRLAKRLLPVRVRELDPSTLPEALGRIHLLPAEGAYDPALHEAALVKALNTDRAWLKKATSLADDAREWLAKEREGALLLRGRALAEAENWSVRTPRDAPAPSSEILELILASRRSQRLRQRLTVAGSVIAAIVAIGLSFYAFQQAQLASEKTVEATEGAARLAVNVAASQLDQGLTDEPAVLLLEAAKAFDDQTASDDMLIAFHRVNQAYATTRRYALPEDAAAFEGPDALYFVDATRNAVQRFDGDGAPADAFVAGAGAAPIDLVGFLRNGDATDLVVVHADGSVERVDALTGTARFSGRLPSADGYTFDAGRAAETVVHGNGVVTRNDFYLGPDGFTRAVGRILDTNDGATFGGEFASSLTYLLAIDGEIVFDGGSMYTDPAAFSRLVRSGATMALEQADVSEDEYSRLAYRTCVLDGGMDASIYSDEMFAQMGMALGEHRCAPLDNDRVLYTNFESTSGGIVRADSIVAPDGTLTSIADLLQGFGQQPTRANLSWLGFDPASGEFGAILNRELMRFSEYQMLPTRSYPDAPGPARFTGDGRLAVYEPWVNSVVVSTLVNEPRPAIADPRQAAVVGGQEKLTPLNPGSCVGYAFFEPFLASGFALPDGATVDYADLENDDDTKTVTIKSAAGGELRLDLAAGTSCAQFSRDGKVLLVHSLQGGEIALYDLDRARADGSLANAKLAAPEGFFTSAFPIDGSAMVTSSAEHSVSVWRRDGEGGAWRARTVYEGDNVVFHAEPNADLSQLLIIESLGAGETAGFLQSVPAGRRWVDLGRDYKWFGLTFAADGAIASGARGVQRVLKLPPLSSLVSEAEANLPPRCRPREPGDYRTSPCWPATL